MISRHDEGLGRRASRHDAAAGVNVTLRAKAPAEVLNRLTIMEAADLRSRTNIKVRDRWRALEIALGEVRPAETLRVLDQRADFYFEIRDAVMEWAGELPEPCVRYRVRTPTGLVFWIPKHLCKAAQPDTAHERGVQ